MKRINLIYKASINRITGLERDAMILAEQLSGRYEVSHYRVTDRRLLSKLGIPNSLKAKVTAAWKTRSHLFDLNIFLEKTRLDLLPLAQCNLLIPNQEMFAQCLVPQLDHLDGVLCKTRYAEDMFSALTPRTKYIGFTSQNRKLTTIQSDYQRFFHLAGKSALRRGTTDILDLWKRNPQFPPLTVVAHHLDSTPYQGCGNLEIWTDYQSEAKILDLQNRCGLHLCLSEAEGFGHFINEAMSIGACVITTQAPPMNELVTPDRGYLIPLDRAVPVPKYFHKAFIFSPQALEQRIREILATPIADRQALGQAARAYYETSQQDFYQNLQAALAYYLD